MAAFTARPIQGSPCLAPCAVHFDAIGMGALSATPYVTTETTDSAFDREFHSLHFEWNFGDPGSGDWTTGAAAMTATPASKNYDIGAIAGHVYENPGTYDVTLTVTNPNGETDSIMHQVVVGDPDSYFSAANTFCFANDDLDWTGCPLTCASDDNCTVTADLDLALEGGDNCSGSDDCADIDSGMKRVLFRRGDAFTSNATLDPFEGTTPGLIEAFGSGAKPSFDLGNALMESGDRWTFVDLALSNCGLDCIFGTVNDDRATFVRIDATYDAACWENNNNVPVETFDNWPYLWALIDVNCTGDSAGQTSYGSWPGSNYFLWMGGTHDHAPTGGGNASTVRNHHMQHSLIAHRSFANPTPAREHLQLRTFDVVGAFTCGNADECATMFDIVQDNALEESASNTFYTVRTCVDAGCNCGLSPSSCGDNTDGTIEAVHDVIFERNFHYWPQDTAADKSSGGIYEIQGGGVTIRNNVFDVQGGFTGALPFVVALGEPLSKASGSTPTGDVHVYNNTIYFNDSIASTFTFASENSSNGTGCPSGTTCRAANNLLVAPNHSGSATTHADYVAASNTKITTPNPFVASVPARGSTDTADFKLAAASAPIDAGYDFNAGADTNRWVYDDALWLCRTDGQWDIGAHEYGASACY
ncbi:MAG: hypothetical protein A3E78_01870 [Alphaproteobacteria bacterium RIFCSPHIGHO2_12_FULL_63_12]|nr:MAG: hypothetical protein A3E78_01870 [Alphaproteobacteria bacterium RIFCSPHIGHO2_12_FULL_63_12]